MTPSVLPPAELPLRCAGNQHRLRWADGVLTAPNHPDADRERALIAMGADPYPCLEIADLWTRYACDLGVLALAPRGPGDRAVTDDDTIVTASGSRLMMMAGIRRSRGRRGHGSELSDRARDVGTLLALGGGLPTRLVLGVVDDWCDRIETGDGRVAAAGPALQAALYGRVRAALQVWLGRPELSLELTMVGTDEAPSVLLADQQIDARLPFSWLRDVWCTGTTTMWGRFTVAAVRTGHGWELTTIDALGGTPQATAVSQ